MKFLAVVVACGLYQGHNRVCLEWVDQSWYASREQCMKRAQEIVGTVKNLTWYAGVKLEKNPTPKCRDQ